MLGRCDAGPARSVIAVCGPAIRSIRLAGGAAGLSCGATLSGYMKTRAHRNLALATVFPVVGYCAGNCECPAHPASTGLRRAALDASREHPVKLPGRFPGKIALPTA